MMGGAWMDGIYGFVGNGRFLEWERRNGMVASQIASEVRRMLWVLRFLSRDNESR